MPLPHVLKVLPQPQQVDKGQEMGRCATLLEQGMVNHMPKTLSEIKESSVGHDQERLMSRLV